MAAVVVWEIVAGLPMIAFAQNGGIVAGVPLVVFAQNGGIVAGVALVALAQNGGIVAGVALVALAQNGEIVAGLPLIALVHSERILADSCVNLFLAILKLLILVTLVIGQFRQLFSELPLVSSFSTPLVAQPRH